MNYRALGIFLVAFITALACALTANGAPSSPVWQRAADTVDQQATREGFELRSVTCHKRTTGHVCELCYSHPLHWLGSAVVWCGRDRCEWIVSLHDERRNGLDPSWCERQ